MDAKKHTAKRWDDCWVYRGGIIEFAPAGKGSRANWYWNFSGARGRAASKAEAKRRIDRLLVNAEAIIESEKAAHCDG